MVRGDERMRKKKKCREVNILLRKQERKKEGRN